MQQNFCLDSDSRVAIYFISKISFPNTTALRKSRQNGHHVIHLSFPAFKKISFAIIYWLDLVSIEFNKQLKSRDTPRGSMSISFLRTQVPSLAQRVKGDRVTVTNRANLSIVFFL